MKEEIKVFGDKAKAIEQGQLFQAVIGSVEGRTVVTLYPTEIDEILREQGSIQADQEKDLD